MQAYEKSEILNESSVAPPAMIPEGPKKIYGKNLATNAFHPPPLKRMNAKINIFDNV